MSPKAILWLLPGILTACTAPCPEPKAPENWTPENSVRYMLGLIRAGNFGKAHFMFSAETRSYLKAEAFAAALHSYPTLRRVVAATQIVGGADVGKRGRILVRNRVLGWQQEIDLRQEFGLWTVHLPRDRMDVLIHRLREKVFQVFDRQGGLHLFPPDYDFLPEGPIPHCETRNHGKEKP